MAKAVQKLSLPITKLRCFLKRSTAQGSTPKRYFLLCLFFLTCNVIILLIYPSLRYLPPPNLRDVLGSYQPPPSHVAETSEVQLRSGQLQKETRSEEDSIVSRSLAGLIIRSKTTGLSRSRPRYCEVEGYNCFFDVGHNTGQDTAAYLQIPNSRVVAVEANPILVKGSKQKFKKQIADGSLVLLEVGITRETADQGAARPMSTFWINKSYDKFSSFREKLGCRDPNGRHPDIGDYSNCESIEVKTMTCADLVKRYGTPSYMKIDIEGLDVECLRSLAKVDPRERPVHISVEGATPKRIEVLVSLGYSRFKVVNQKDLKKFRTKETSRLGQSGPFGADAVDYFVGKRWETGPEVLGRLPIPPEIVANAWFDVHARREEETTDRIRIAS